MQETARRFLIVLYKAIITALKIFCNKKNNHDKLFKREELLNVVNELMRQSNDLATMERKVFEHNVKVYFGGLFENYMQADLLHARPHGADLTMEDQSKLLDALRKNYPNIDEDVMKRSKPMWEDRASRRKVFAGNFLRRVLC